jgi:hypothetical protein
MKNLVSRFAALTALITTCAGAIAQYNLDWNLPGDPALGGGVPSSSYSAAAPGHAGFWNDIPAQGSPSIMLRDLAGNLTGVVLLGPAGGIGNGFNNPLLSGDYRLLMADGRSLGDDTWTFTGLPNGLFHLYTYAVRPSGVVTNTTVTVPGATIEAQVVTGPIPPNTFQLGITHALHEKLVTDGTLSVRVTEGVSSAYLNGMQLIAVPEPALLISFGAGLVALMRRRYKQ